MRNLLIGILSVLAVSCETTTFKWGYLNNPEKILLDAKNAIETGNIGLWKSVTSGNPYCKYSSKTGLAFLKQEMRNLTYNRIEEVNTESFNRGSEASVVFTPNYIKDYSTKLLDRNGRVKTTIVIRCKFELPKGVAERDPYNTSDFSKAYCEIKGLKINDRYFPEHPICD